MGGFIIIDAEHNRLSRFEHNALSLYFPKKAESGHRPEHIKCPRSLRGQLLVDTWSHRILRLDSVDENSEKCVVAGTSNSFGGDNKSLCFPSDVVELPSGELIIADTQNNRLMRWKSGSSEGCPIDQRFEMPISLALGGDCLYVSERKAGRVVQFNLESGEVRVVIERLYRPWGIALFERKLFVCDEWNHCVVEVDLDGVTAECRLDMGIAKAPEILGDVTIETGYVPNNVPNPPSLSPFL